MSISPNYPTVYRSTDSGAPTLNNTIGAWPAVIKACLETGYGSKTVTSISVASGLATVTCAAHGYTGAYAAYVLIEGCPEPLLNGKKQPGGVLTNSFTYPAPGVPDGTYTGTINAKRAPAGWSEVYASGTGISAFRSQNVESTQFVLQVDDSQSGAASTTNARCVAAESISPAGVLSMPFPTASQRSGGLYIQKGPNSATAKNWTVIADDRFVYLYLSFSTSTGCVYWFGDFKSYLPVDAFNCALLASAGAHTSVSTSSSNFNINAAGGAIAGPPYIARNFDGSTAGSINSSVVGVTGRFSEATGVPSKVVVSPLHLMGTGGATSHMRGALPGLAHTLDFNALANNTYLSFPTGERLLVLTGASTEMFAVRLDAPWY